MRIFILLVLFFSCIYYSCKTAAPIARKETAKPVVIQPPSQPALVTKPKESLKEKKEFKIALLLPLYLNQNLEVDTSKTESDIELLSLPALSFYEGVLLAVDSLEKTGMKVKLSVFDITQDTSAKHFLVMNYQSLKTSDIIFASFPSTQVAVSAETASHLGLKLVLAQFGNTFLLKDNPNLVLASPSAITQCKLMADFTVDKFTDANFIVLSRKVKRENELANTFKEETERLLHSDKYKSQNNTILFDCSDTSQSIIKYLSPNKKNVLYFPSSDESFVSSVLAGFDTLNQNMVVIGLPTWENFESVQLNNLVNIEVYIFSTTYIDYDAPGVKLIRKNYISQYKSDPFPNAYQGYDLTYYFAELFKEHDINFIDHIANDSLNSEFKFVRETEKSGFENVSFSVLKYEGYKLLKVNK